MSALSANDWVLWTVEEDFEAAAKEITMKGHSLNYTKPVKYPCLARHALDGEINYFSYVYVSDVNGLMKAHFEKRSAEEGSYIDLKPHRTHHLAISRVSNGFIITAEEVYRDSDGTLMAAKATNVATTEHDFVDMFAGYASANFMKEGFELLLQVIKPKKEDR